MFKDRSGIVLLEGTRKLPASDAPVLTDLARELAELLPLVTFRSGNALGSDTAFARGVLAVDPRRMQYVVPRAAKGRGRMHGRSTMYAFDDLAEHEVSRLAGATIAATPHYRGLVEAYITRGPKTRLGASAAYLLRDTLKVTGAPDAGIVPANAGVFYVNPADPMKGGTGHTIRVCLQQNLPVFYQNI